MKILLDTEDRLLIRHVVNTNPKTKVLINKIGNFLGININVLPNDTAVPLPLTIEVNKETLLKVILKANTIANPTNLIGNSIKSLLGDLFKVQEQSNEKVSLNTYKES